MANIKNRLKRIIREQYDRDPSPGYDYDPDSDPAQRAQADMEHMQYEEYKAWAKETGQVTPAASSVMATYFVEQGLTDDAAQIDMMASGYGVDPQDVMRDIKRQQAEYDAGGVLSDEESYERSFKESLMRKTRRISRRQIRRLIEQQVEHDLDVELASEIEPLEDAWEGGNNLALDIDHSMVTKNIDAEEQPTGPETLNITTGEVETAPVTEARLRRMVRRILRAR